VVGSDAFFRALVETAASPFVVLDPSLTLLYASPSITEMLGWDPQDWLGRSIAELLTPDSIEVAAAGIDDLFTTDAYAEMIGGPVRLFVRGIDGTVHTLDVEASPPERTGIAGIVAQLHRAGGSQAMSDAIDAILEGENPKLALARMASLIEHDIADATAVLASEWDGVGFGQVAGAMGPLHLPALRTADRDAIYAALTSDEEVVDIFESLDPYTRADAVALGRRSCWLAPVRVAPDEPTTAALIVWHLLPGPPGALYRADVGRAVRLAQLALRWEGQQRMLGWDATHDRLTGLTNRSEFQNRLDRHRGTGRAVLYCDLDDFKPVNDQWGHRAGDEVLAAVATRLRETVGAHLAARLGGDEFAVLIEDLQSPEAAVTVANRILAALQPAIEAQGQLAVIGCSIGVAIDGSGLASADLLLDEADRVLREGKAQGKNQVRVAFLDPPGSR
jgi:diguanylate cyclase (GGDEF)-like protein/PAS domain S-box-containing protein